MKIVLATKSVPYPLTNGSAIRNYQFIRWLSTRHELTLVTFVRNDEEQRGLSTLTDFCREIIRIDERRTLWRKARDAVRSITTGVPYTICAHNSPRFRAALANATVDAGLLQLQELYLHASLPPTDIPVVLDAHNVEATILERMALIETRAVAKRIYRWQARAMDRYERKAVPGFAGVISLSEQERDRFRLLNSQVALAPNGVERRATLPQLQLRGDTIVFVGTLEYPPNRDALEHFIVEILPRIELQLPEIEFRIIGALPRWAERYQGRRGVRFLGRVEDLTSEFARAAVMVVPLRAGGGTRLKILDAFTAGVPVVSTTIGAEGLGVVDGQQLMLRDEPESFATAVCELVREPERRHALAANAFRWSQDTLGWEEIIRSLEPFYQEVV